MNYQFPFPFFILNILLLNCSFILLRIRVLLLWSVNFVLEVENFILLESSSLRLMSSFVDSIELGLVMELLKRNW
jgi:hypothetical protein